MSSSTDWFYGEMNRLIPMCSFLKIWVFTVLRFYCLTSVPSWWIRRKKTIKKPSKNKHWIPHFQASVDWKFIARSIDFSAFLCCLRWDAPGDMVPRSKNEDVFRNFIFWNTILRSTWLNTVPHLCKILNSFLTIFLMFF